MIALRRSMHTRKRCNAHHKICNTYPANLFKLYIELTVQKPLQFRAQRFPCFYWMQRTRTRCGRPKVSRVTAQAIIAALQILFKTSTQRLNRALQGPKIPPRRFFGHNSAPWSRRGTRIGGNDSNKRPGAPQTLQHLEKKKLCIILAFWNHKRKHVSLALLLPSKTLRDTYDVPFSGPYLAL